MKLGYQTAKVAYRRNVIQRLILAEPISSVKELKRLMEENGIMVSERTLQLDLQVLEIRTWKEYAHLQKIREEFQRSGDEIDAILRDVGIT